MLLLFVLGTALGYVLQRFLPKQSQKSASPDVQKAALILPPDAVQIQACSNNRGTLYVKPQDISAGPVYMVYKGDIVGIGFMLSQDDFLQGKDFKNLSGMDVTVDHVNVGLFSEGHEGYTAPHYHVDLYTITREEEAQIVCPQTASPTAQATQSADLVPNPAESQEVSNQGVMSNKEETETAPTTRVSPTRRPVTSP